MRSSFARSAASRSTRSASCFFISRWSGFSFAKPDSICFFSVSLTDRSLAASVSISSRSFCSCSRRFFASRGTPALSCCVFTYLMTAMDPFLMCSISCSNSFRFAISVCNCFDRFAVSSMYLTGSNLPCRKFASSRLSVERIDSSSARMPSVSRAFSRSSRTLSSDSRSGVPRVGRPTPELVGTPSQSWKAVSSPASHLRSASSRESPPDVEAPSQAAVPLDSPFIQADSPRSPAGGAESCFVPHTTHSPCGFTSPPQTRHTCSETVPTVGFTATGAAPSRASRARPTPMKIGGAHHPPRGYLIVRTALSYNNLDRAERKGTLPSKAVPESPDFGTRSHYARRGLGSDDLQHLPANDNDGNGQSDQGNAGSDVSVTTQGEDQVGCNDRRQEEETSGLDRDEDSSVHGSGSHLVGDDHERSFDRGERDQDLRSWRPRDAHDRDSEEEDGDDHKDHEISEPAPVAFVHAEFSIPPCRHMPVAREMGQRRPRSRAGDAVLPANGVCA